MTTAIPRTHARNLTPNRTCTTTKWHVGTSPSSARPRILTHNGNPIPRTLGPRHHFTLSALPPYLLAPAVFTALLLILWTWKCCMLVAFQGKILYMPYIPPFARREQIAAYAPQCGGAVWEERRIRAEDGVELGVVAARAGTGGRRRVVVCYFHGNGGSLPPRLPMLSRALRAAERELAGTETQILLLALSYRGYWTSSGAPSQRGLERDARALLRHANATADSDATPTRLVLWGQSLGAGVATHAAAEYEGAVPLAGLLLETPFTSVRRMLRALYPQRWLPYRYLGVFLRSRWDSGAALRRMGGGGGLRVGILSAGADEVVPRGEAEALEGVCREVGLEVWRREVQGVLHNGVMGKWEGRGGVARLVREAVEGEERLQRQAVEVGEKRG